MVNELQEFVGFYVDRFYELGDGRFRIKLSKKGAQANLQIILSHTINKTKYIEKGEQPTDFTMAVRKRIEGFQIKSIKQLNNDRIVMLELKKGDSEANLIAEMFGGGNLIITDNTMGMLLVYKRRQFKDRTMAPHLEYKAPKRSSEYKTEKITIKEGFKTLQEELDEFYHENPVDMEEKRHNALEEQLKASIEKQRKIMGGIDSDIETNKEIAEKIFRNMNEINDIINELKKSKRMTLEELRSRTKIGVQSIDLKNKTVTIEID